MDFSLVALGAVLIAWAFVVRFWNQRNDARATIAERDRSIEEAKAQIADLLTENELANKECEQHRIVIEAAKEERLKLLKQHAEDGNALSEQRAALRGSAESFRIQAEKIVRLSKDIDERSQIMFQQIELIEKYRRLNEALIANSQQRGEGGRFTKRATAAKA